MNEMDYKEMLHTLLLTFAAGVEDEGALHVITLIEGYTDCPHVEEACKELRVLFLERCNNKVSDLISIEALTVMKPIPTLRLADFL